MIAQLLDVGQVLSSFIGDTRTAFPVIALSSILLPFVLGFVWLVLIRVRGVCCNRRSGHV